LNVQSSAEYNPLDHFDRPPATKAQARAARRAEKATKQQHQSRSAPPLVAKSETQAELLSCLRDGESVFAIGPAGTGKTYLPARIAAQKLLSGSIDKIIVARVTVSDRRHALGFLPGKLEAKMEPWLIPVIEGIRAEMSLQTYEQLKGQGKIEYCSFEHIRGRTFGNCVVILDEAQNATFKDLKVFLTRQGENCQVVVTGDLDQIDIPDSGLDEVIDLCERYNVPMDIVEFGEDEVVRSAGAKAWVKAFNRHQTVH
jgi:phosphate starvation-inducible PhoH-like protein